MVIHKLNTVYIAIPTHKKYLEYARCTALKPFLSGDLGSGIVLDPQGLIPELLPYRLYICRTGEHILKDIYIPVLINPGFRRKIIFNIYYPVLAVGILLHGHIALSRRYKAVKDHVLIHTRTLYAAVYLLCDIDK